MYHKPHITVTFHDLFLLREEYELKVNTITVQVYVASLLKFERGALQASTDMCPYIEMKFDRRKPLGEFKAAVCEVRRTKSI